MTPNFQLKLLDDVQNLDEFVYGRRIWRNWELRHKGTNRCGSKRIRTVLLNEATSLFSENFRPKIEEHLRDNQHVA